MTITETERLRLEEAGPEDALFFMELMNSPGYIAFIGDRGIDSVQKAIGYIQENLVASYDNNGYGLFKMVLKERERAIGICGLLKRAYLEHTDIGYAILPEYEGKGYTFEAAKSIMEYATTILKLHPILGITKKTNRASRRLLDKIGLHETGTIIPPDGNEELLLYATE